MGMERSQRMSGADRRAQVLAIAAEEFATGGLHGTSTEVIARRAGITQAYVFRMFATKRALFLAVVVPAFDQMTRAMLDAAGHTTGLEALSRMGEAYHALLADRTLVLLQLQGFAACGEETVRQAVRGCVARMWQAVAQTTGLDPVTVKAFLAFGMLLNDAAALEVADVGEPWAEGITTRIRPGLFAHIGAGTNR